MAFKDLNLDNRLVAVHTDMLWHQDFCILGGVTQVGKVIIDKRPTAGTDGADVYYGHDFNMMQNRKQLRYVVAHEAGHKMLRHCTDYRHLHKKYPREFAMAVDYVVNINIEKLDTKFGSAEAFLERPVGVTALVSQKYENMSVPEVIRDLLQNGMPPDQQKPQAGQGGGAGDPMDDHMEPEGSGEDGEMTPEEQEKFEKVKQLIEDAVLQGELVQKQLRGKDGSPNNMLSGFREQHTDWRGPLKRWFEEIVEGDDQSRFSPPNKRMLPQGIIMPSHFSEATGEIIVACDTSGSMGSVYPIVFGEIANIAKTASPARLRILWWDTQVCGDEVFTAKDYGNIRNVMKPVGGGGTTASCVAAYIKAKGYKPKGTIMLTDGYIESAYDTASGNLLWGVVGNRSFRPSRGKALYIEET